MVPPLLDASDAPDTLDALGPAIETRLLAADVGAVFTKVYLLQEVEGERRLVATGQAPSIADTGEPAVEAALAQALARALEHAGQRLDGSGPPRVLLTSLGTTSAPTRKPR